MGSRVVRGSLSGTTGRRRVPIDGKRSGLRRRNLIDLTGGFIGPPFFSLSEIERAFSSGQPFIEHTTGDPEGRPARVAEIVCADTAGLAAGDAILSFLRDGREYFLLTVKKTPPRPDDPASFRGHLTILEPLAVAVRKRVLARAEVGIVPGAASVLHSVRVRLFDEHTGERLASYQAVLLMDKLLAWLIRPVLAEEDVDLAWGD